MIHRRGLITGLISFVAAPAIVRAANIMPVKVYDPNAWVTEVWNELERLEFAEMIYRITPTDTPFLAFIRHS